MIPIQIGLIAHLQPNQIVPQDRLALLRNRQPEVVRIVERHAQVPVHVDEGGDVGQEVEELVGVY